MPNDRTLPSKRPTQDDQHIRKPLGINRWLIPFGVMATITLWVTTAVLIGTDTDPGITTIEMAIFAGTSIATMTTVVRGLQYVLHKSMADDHQMIRDDVEDLRGIVLELRARLVVAASETRALLEQISAKQNRLAELYWQNLADEVSADAKPNGSVVPFGRRHT